MRTSLGLLAYCRAGFEGELAAELQERAGVLNIAGYARCERQSGFVEFICDDAVSLSERLHARNLIFARQSLVQFATLDPLPRTDRASPIVEALTAWVKQNPDMTFGSVTVDHSDADEGRQLAGLARSFGNALRGVLRKANLISQRDDVSQLKLHVFLRNETSCSIGFSDPRRSSPFELGIPRLKTHPEAPSRSALKLEEAFLVLLTSAEREAWLRNGMKACDLGAAPGGWTWVLTRYGIHVTAIDNGPLRESLMDSGQVTHLRADGFRWNPSKRLDWMVCDMVEQPRRVADRMAEWFAEGWCDRAVFNLKLPMKKRWQEVEQCLVQFKHATGKPLQVRAKQLYHDREEITVFAGPRSKS